jgi:hypothetical protein
MPWPRVRGQAFAGHVMQGQPMQLSLHFRRESLECILVALAPGDQQLRDVPLGIVHHRFGSKNVSSVHFGVEIYGTLRSLVPRTIGRFSINVPSIDTAQHNIGAGYGVS